MKIRILTVLFCVQRVGQRWGLEHDPGWRQANTVLFESASGGRTAVSCLTLGLQV